ncbi:hypothetical protein MRX96_022960 [Rhipicephalus microplus]
MDDSDEDDDDSSTSSAPLQPPPRSSGINGKVLLLAGALALVVSFATTLTVGLVFPHRGSAAAKTSNITHEGRCLTHSWLSIGSHVLSSEHQQPESEQRDASLQNLPAATQRRLNQDNDAGYGLPLPAQPQRLAHVSNINFLRRDRRSTSIAVGLCASSLLRDDRGVHLVHDNRKAFSTVAGHA